MSWIDIPIVKVMEYFSSIMIYFMNFAYKAGSLLGVVGLSWSAFRLINARMQIKQLVWDTIFKWVLYLLLLNLYPPVTMGLVKISTTMALESSGIVQGVGQDQYQTSLAKMLKDMRDSIQTDLQKYQDYQNNLNAELTKQFPGITITTQFMEQRDTQTWNKYLNKLKGELEMSDYFDFGADKRIEQAYKTIDEYEHKTFSATTYYNEAVLSAINNVLVEKDVAKIDEDGNTNIESYVSLDIFLSYADGRSSPFLSPSAMMRIALLSGKVMWSKLQYTFIQEDDEWDAQNREKHSHVIGKVTEIMHDASFFVQRIPLELAVGVCCIVLILSCGFAMIQYSMTIIEYTIVMAIGAFYIPFVLFDGTKSLPKKLVPVFFGFFLKMLIMTICLFYVFYLFIYQTAEILYDNTLGFHLESIASCIFNCLIAFILTQNAPKIAQTMLTGQPQLSMGEFMQAAGTVGAAGIAAKKATNAVGKAKNAVGDGVRAIGNGAINTVGGMNRIASAGKAFQEHAPTDASAGQKAMLFAKGATYAAASSVKESALRKGEDFLHGKKGNGSSSSGGGNASFHQQEGGSSSSPLSSTSNAKFQTASMTDSNGTRRNLSVKEFMQEKKAQGNEVYADYEKHKAEKQAKKAETEKQTPDKPNATVQNMTDKTRLS